MKYTEFHKKAAEIEMRFGGTRGTKIRNSVDFQ
jgi:hypothetical protein